MNVYPFYEDELLEEDGKLDDEIEVIDEIADDEDGDLFIFSLIMTNTADEEKIKINFEEQNGEYKYVNTETNGVELDCSVFVERRENDKFALISKQMINGVEVSKKEMPISYEVLTEYAVDDDEEYEFDDEDDFDLGTDLD